VTKENDETIEMDISSEEVKKLLEKTEDREEDPEEQEKG
jgi:hypothetical protein